ncbi:MAG: SAM-dependent methyltransferase, partial [Firmicutes bacterium]|nr:SAM-dependent methyltransferase [Bacillota bacterium]
MNKLNLSERMTLLASLVRGRSAADIGTDHGFVPVFLLREGLADRVILTDINRGPLEKARKNIEDLGLSKELTDLRLGPGLTVLEKGEVDTVIIAGMGGELIASILAEDLEKSRSFGFYVLQPRSRENVLRQWLDDNNFYVTDERLVREKGRICQVICASPEGEGEVFKDPTDYIYPPMLMASDEPIAREYFEREKKRLK